MCCVIKAIAGWHMANTATVCRERTGGQGYLSCNKFGYAIGGSHSSMTAEGDNSVLMQKVASERLMAMKPSMLQVASSYVPGFLSRMFGWADVTSTSYLHALLKSREQAQFMELGMKMMRAGKQGRYDTWVYQEQDLVQASARAYGERLISECFAEAISKAEPSLEPVLSKLYHLYLISAVEMDLGYFVTSGLMSAWTGAGVGRVAAELCRDVSSQALALCEAFGFSDEILRAPIASDWIKFNTVDNQGEVIGVEF